MIIAVDFDGTLCSTPFPGARAEDIDPRAVEVLLKHVSRGARLILWTCRHDETLKAAVKACEEVGLHFVAVNENDPAHVTRWNAAHQHAPGFSPKIYADIYIDDKGNQISGKVDWNKIDLQLFLLEFNERGAKQ